MSRHLIIGLAVAAASLVTLSAQTGTIMPTPFQTAFSNTGAVINNACVWTYTAGTTTPAATYTDVGLGTPNANPIRTDSAGRFTAFLSPGAAYKFVYETSCTPPAHGTVLRTADNIGGTPSASGTVDIVGTAGETLTAGQCAYLSDGSGGKTAGRWYKCDSGTAYSVLSPTLGLAPSAITSGSSGPIRQAGLVTGLSALSVGTAYYVSTAGGLTSSAPTYRRFVGIADTTTSLVVAANPPTLNLNVGTNTFTVAGSSGNTVVGGTLAVTGTTALTGDLSVNGGKATVTASTGAITVTAPAATAATMELSAPASYSPRVRFTEASTPVWSAGYNIADSAKNFEIYNHTHSSDMLSLSSGGTLILKSPASTAYAVISAVSNSYAAAVQLREGTTQKWFLGMNITGTGRDLEFYNATNSLTKFQLTEAGALKLSNYGAGTATFDANGNITSVSDERLKRNIRPFTRGLNAIRMLSPILHGYTAASGLDPTRDTYAGFSAQNVRAAIPEAVDVSKDGYLTLSDRGILAALVNAQKELDRRLRIWQAVSVAMAALLAIGGLWGFRAR